MYDVATGTGLFDQTVSGRLCSSDDAALGVDRPLDVLRAPVVALGALGELGHRAHLGVREARRSTVGGARGDHVEHDLVDEEVIGRDGAADDGLPHPGRGLDGDLRAVAVGRVQRHRHAGGAGGEHALDDDGHLAVADAAVGAVGERALGVQARPAARHVLEHRVGARDPQVRVVLAGARGVGAVLGRRAGAHGDRDVLAQRAVGGADRGSDGARGDGEPAGHREAGPQQRAEARGLAAHQLDLDAVAQVEHRPAHEHRRGRAEGRVGRVVEALARRRARARAAARSAPRARPAPPAAPAKRRGRSGCRARRRGESERSHAAGRCMRGARRPCRRGWPSRAAAARSRPRGSPRSPITAASLARRFQAKTGVTIRSSSSTAFGISVRSSHSSTHRERCVSSSLIPPASRRGRRLVPRRELPVDESGHLVKRDRVVADAHEVRRQVVLRRGPARLDQLEAVAPVAHEVLGVRDLLGHRRVAEVQEHAARRPLLHARDVLVGDPEQPEDHQRGQLVGQRRHQVGRAVAGEAVEHRRASAHGSAAPARRRGAA